MLFFIINMGHEEMKIIKSCTLSYFTPAQYGNLSEVRQNNQESVFSNIWATASETEVGILPAIPASSKMIFPGDHIPLRKLLLKDAPILVDMQEKIEWSDTYF